MLLYQSCNFFFLLFLIIPSYGKEIKTITGQPLKRTVYYFSVKGDDKNDGSAEHPLKTIAYLNTLSLNPGDSVLLNGSEEFIGELSIKPYIKGMATKPVLIASYGNGRATINAGNGTALSLNQSGYINIQNLYCKGSGRKEGNTKPGVAISNCNNINISNIGVSGFQKAGLQLYDCMNANINNIDAHDNGAAGISVDGDYGNKLSSHNIIITNCNAVNNPGDPTNLTNHSGNGIIVGNCTGVLIDHCIATNNGWDMPRIGNGPVGIWCYEADSVTIQHCISYKNKTSKGGEDGGGYDLDGGTTNSVIQYCLSYENYGSAFGIFQYAGASKWENNVVRFCISENDGKVSAAHAGAYVWNSSHDSAQFKDFLFYNNTIYNDSGTAISYSVESDHSNFKFYNNIFMAADSLLRGNYGSDVFVANDWWSLKEGFNIKDENNFENWCNANNKEQINGVIKGLNVNVPFKQAGNATLTDVNTLSSFDNYTINGASPVTQAGIDLQALFNINIGDKDFNGKPADKKYLGACTHQ